MTVAVRLRAELCDSRVGFCPAWLTAAFADMYPDDTVLWPAEDAPTVLASDEEWDWITEHLVVVADAVDHTLGLLRAVDGGWWLVCTYSTGGERFVVSTTAPSVTALGQGFVVLISRRSMPDVVAPKGVVA